MKIEKGIYKHFKGKTYEVIGIGKHSETLDEYVIYKPQYESEEEYWVRPVEMFLESVEIDGKTVPRFKPLKKSAVVA